MIVSPTGNIINIEFERKNTKFRIVKTDGENKDVWNTIDTIKNLSNGKTKEITRRELSKI